MSSKLTPVLYLAPFAQIERRVPRLPYRMLPGRIALMQHPVVPSESGLLLAAGTERSVWVCNSCGRAYTRFPGNPKFPGLLCEDCGGTDIEEGRKPVGETDGLHLEPDVCVVAECRIEIGPERARRSLAEPGDVLVLKPESGARIDAPQGGWDGWDSRTLRMLGLGAQPWQDRILARLTADGLEPMPGWSLVEREPSRLGSGLVQAKEEFEPYGTCLSGEGEGRRLAFPGQEFWTFLGAPKEWALVRSQRSLAPFAKGA